MSLISGAIVNELALTAIAGKLESVVHKIMTQCSNKIALIVTDKAVYPIIAAKCLGSDELDSHLQSLHAWMTEHVKKQKKRGVMACSVRIVSSALGQRIVCTCDTCHEVFVAFS
jgi:hypothetical protein